MKQVIIAPLVTEKTALAEAQGVYTFKVYAGATKPEIEKEFGELFGDKIKIKKIAISNVRKKTRLFGRRRELTKRKAFKKASIFLEDKTAHIDLAKLS